MPRARYYEGMGFRFQILDWKRDRVILLVFVLFYITFGFFASRFQSHIIYIPDKQDFYTCPLMQSAERIDHQGTRMYFKDNGERVGVVYHGNAGSACDRALYAELLERHGYSYLIVEYAGYSGDTARSPSHALLKQDVEHVIDFMQSKNFTRSVILGESIGTGFASYHAKLAPPDKLILISPFTNILNVAKDEFWYYPVSLMVDNALDNVEVLAAYSGNVLVIHGRQDDILPLHFGKELYGGLKSTKKQMVIIEGAGHNDLFEHPETYAAIEAFLR